MIVTCHQLKTAVICGFKIVSLSKETKSLILAIEGSFRHFVRQMNECSFGSIVIRSQGGRVKARGTIYLSNIRMVFVASKPGGSFTAFDIPLVCNLTVICFLYVVAWIFTRAILYIDLLV